MMISEILGTEQVCTREIEGLCIFENGHTARTATRKSIPQQLSTVTVSLASSTNLKETRGQCETKKMIRQENSNECDE